MFRLFFFFCLLFHFNANSQNELLLNDWDLKGKVKFVYELSYKVKQSHKFTDLTDELMMGGFIKIIFLSIMVE